MMPSQINFGGFRDYETVCPASVRIKVTTGEMERHKQDYPQEGNGFAGGSRRLLLSPYPLWLTHLEVCVVLVSFSLLRWWPVSSGWCHSCDNKVCGVFQQQFQERLGDTKRVAADTSVGERQPSGCLYLCASSRRTQRQEKHCQWPSAGVHVSDQILRKRKTSAQSPATCSLIRIHQRRSQLACLPWMPCSPHRWQQDHTKHILELSVKESGDDVVKVILL